MIPTLSRLFSVLALVALMVPFAAARQAEGTTLTGQLVCSTCWFEADRATTPYGSDADVKCAIRCAKGGIPAAIAVSDKGSVTLYVVEEGKYSFTKDGKDWSALTGRRVEVTGSVRREGDKHVVKVDALKVLPADNH